MEFYSGWFWGVVMSLVMTGSFIVMDQNKARFKKKKKALEMRKSVNSGSRCNMVITSDDITNSAAWVWNCGEESKPRGMTRWFWEWNSRMDVLFVLSVKMLSFKRSFRFTKKLMGWYKHFSYIPRPHSFLVISLSKNPTWVVHLLQLMNLC